MSMARSYQGGKGPKRKSKNRWWRKKKKNSWPNKQGKNKYLQSQEIPRETKEKATKIRNKQRL